MVDPVAEDWTRVAARVEAEMEVRAWRPNDVYLRANVDPKTLARLLEGQRLRGDAARRLAGLFGWREDGLTRLARGLEPELAPQTTGGLDQRLSAVESDLAEIRASVQQLLADREAPEASA